MSHFSVVRLSWNKEHLGELSNILQSLALSVKGTYASNKVVTNRYNVSQYMLSCIEFKSMAPIGLVLTSEDSLALCYDMEQNHSESESHQEKLHQAISAITNAFGEYRGKLELEKIKANLPQGTNVNVKVH